MVQVADNVTKTPVRLGGFQKPALRRVDVRALARRRLRAGFDSAETTDNNRRHWARADALSADAAASPEVRRTLRNRARYEVANNSYARGIVLTLANDSVGTGPRLQMLSDDPTLNRNVESDFHSWAQAVGLAQKLRTMRMARSQDGESFAVLAFNPFVEHDVQLDMLLVEADQVASPWRHIQASTGGRPVLDDLATPSPTASSRTTPEFEPVDLRRVRDSSAASMIHVFRQDRPASTGHPGSRRLAALRATAARHPGCPRRPRRRPISRGSFTPTPGQRRAEPSSRWI